jgi:hypothetical protein
MDNLSVSANAAQFSMPNALASGSSYAVSHSSAAKRREAARSPPAPAPAPGDVDTVRVTCEAR